MKKIVVVLIMVLAFVSCNVTPKPTQKDFNDGVVVILEDMLKIIEHNTYQIDSLNKVVDTLNTKIEELEK